MEEAFCAVFAEAAIATNKRRSGVRVATPFVDLLYEQGEALDHQVPLSSGALEYDYHRGRLSLTVVTHRSTTDSSHADLVSLVRWLLMNRNLNLVHAYYEIFDVRPTGTSYNIVDQLDTTELNFEIVFRIREAVFA